ncbi:class I SAM-dependent methyltransferase [Clostridium puniceum]|uniref:class I SAM-dependent methyltransferase n=1 Tax=Clostridium puniceum TaxID=29367 RepID=UPI0013010A6D|nr:class I SAM-dependent methyltransferase [Clostridium puniceum]
MKNYLEIGTYIGESINVISDICDVCYSITAPIDAPYSMKNWCKDANIPDYSERLATSKNIRHYYCDSKTFDFSSIDEKIDVYFIDGDHSYYGVYHDTKNIFENKNEDSFVIGHDFKRQGAVFNEDVILAVKNVLKQEFDNVFVTNNNICGIYIPKKYQKDFPLKKLGYSEEREELYTYDTSIRPNINK